MAKGRVKKKLKDAFSRLKPESTEEFLPDISEIDMINRSQRGRGQAPQTMETRPSDPLDIVRSGRDQENARMGSGFIARRKEKKARINDAFDPLPPDEQGTGRERFANILGNLGVAFAQSPTQLKAAQSIADMTGEGLQSALGNKLEGRLNFAGNIPDVGEGGAGGGEGLQPLFRTLGSGIESGQHSAKLLPTIPDGPSGLPQIPEFQTARDTPNVKTPRGLKSELAERIRGKFTQDEKDRVAVANEAERLRFDAGVELKKLTQKDREIKATEDDFAAAEVDRNASIEIQRLTSESTLFRNEKQAALAISSLNELNDKDQKAARDALAMLEKVKADDERRRIDAGDPSREGEEKGWQTIGQMLANNMSISPSVFEGLVGKSSADNFRARMLQTTEPTSEDPNNADLEIVNPIYAAWATPEDVQRIQNKLDEAAAVVADPVVVDATKEEAIRAAEGVTGMAKRGSASVARWIGKGFAPGIRLKLLNPDGSFRKIITTDQKHVDKLKAALVDFVILEPIQNKAPHGLFGVQK